MNGDSTVPGHLTYDPTQSQGTDAWQRSVTASRELNQKLKEKGVLP